MSNVSRFTIVVIALIMTACGGAATTPSAQTTLPPQTTAIPSVEPSNTTAEAVEVNAKTFTFVDGTYVLFKVDEIFNGALNTVVGQSNTSGVAQGSISLDYANPSSASLSPITIDLQSLATDNDFRNRSLHGLILQTGIDTNRYAQFETTGFSGLPDSVTVGETYNFQITGNMTIHGTTLPLTFDAQVTPISDTRLEGSATAITQYELFGVQILRLPREVAEVHKDVILEIDFVAEAQ